VVVLPSLAATWLVARRVPQPTAVAGQQRQEQLEAMTSTPHDYSTTGLTDWTKRPAGSGPRPNG
jgi:hypothetical protein